MSVLSSKYIFRMKSCRQKARLVDFGLLQVHEVDCMETYAPVVNFIAVQMLFVIVAILDIELDQTDVVTAFLHGDLDEDIYIQVPEEFRDPKHPGKMCKLMKSFDGPRRAPRQWCAKIYPFIAALGFKNSPNDPCLYVLYDSAYLRINALTLMTY